MTWQCSPTLARLCPPNDVYLFFSTNPCHEVVTLDGDYSDRVKHLVVENEYEYCVSATSDSVFDNISIHGATFYWHFGRMPSKMPCW